MQKNSITGKIILLLLFVSVIIGIYLSLQFKVEKTIPSIDTVISSFRPSIGVVEIFGQIHAPIDSGGLIATARLPEILTTLRTFRKDDRIKAVIIRINSPGGTIGAVQEITKEIQRIRDAGKPVVASIADIGTSGGYYIAASCDKIVANSGSILGSIGVIFMSPDLSGLFEKIGIEIETIQSGPYKDVGAMHRGHTEDEKKFLQKVIDDVYKQFIVAVSSGRNIPLNKVRELAQGQIFTGRMAKQLNLIDKLGDMTAAKELAEELAQITDAKLIRRPVGKWQQIFRFLNRGNIQIDLFGAKNFSIPVYMHNR